MYLCLREGGKRHIWCVNVYARISGRKIVMSETDLDSLSITLQMTDTPRAKTHYIYVQKKHIIRIIYDEGCYFSRRLGPDTVA